MSRQDNRRGVLTHAYEAAYEAYTASSVTSTEAWCRVAEALTAIANSMTEDMLIPEPKDADWDV